MIAFFTSSSATTTRPDSQPYGEHLHGAGKKGWQWRWPDAAGGVAWGVVAIIVVMVGSAALDCFGLPFADVALVGSLALASGSVVWLARYPSSNSAKKTTRNRTSWTAEIQRRLQAVMAGAAARTGASVGSADPSPSRPQDGIEINFRDFVTTEPVQIVFRDAPVADRLGIRFRDVPVVGGLWIDFRDMPATVAAGVSFRNSVVEEVA